MRFCQECGTKFVSPPEEEPVTIPTSNLPPEKKPLFKMQVKTSEIKTSKPKKENSGTRKGMKIWAIVCLVFAVIYSSLGNVIGEPGMSVGMGCFFGVLAGMFWVLSKSPKDKPCILGKETGLKKKKFVLLSVGLAVALLVVGVGMSSSGTTTQQPGASSSEQTADKTPPKNDAEEKQEPVAAPEVKEETPEIELKTDFEKAVWKIAKDNGGKLVSIESLNLEGVVGTNVIAAIVCKNDETVVNDILAAIAEETKNNETDESTIINFGDIKEGDNGAVLVMAGVYGDGTFEIASTSLDFNSARNKWIKGQFSAWDGSHYKLKEMILNRMNDEKSFKHIETNYKSIDNEDDCKEINDLLKQAGYSSRVEVGDLFVSTQFSGKNAFGGTVKNIAYGIASYKNNAFTLLGIE